MNKKYLCLTTLLFLPYLAVGSTGLTPEEIADGLNSRYYNLVDNCGANKAAYYCSGIVIHGESNESTHMPWTPPSDRSMAYSFLRGDIPSGIFSDFDYGIILTPNDNFSGDEFVPNYRCSYAINGITDSREDDGCGRIGEFVETAPCQSQGIFTAIDWITAVIVNPYDSLCGFDLKSQWGDSSSSAFEAMIKSTALNLDVGNNVSNNEIVIETWEDEPVVNLPIEVIFFADRVENKSITPKNLIKAQEAQVNYVNETNDWIPIIHMNETISNGYHQFDFSYSESEQAILPN